MEVLSTSGLRNLPLGSVRVSVCGYDVFLERGIRLVLVS